MVCGLERKRSRGKREVENGEVYWNRVCSVEC